MYRTAALRPGTIEAQYLDTIEAGIYIGIIKEIKGDPDPIKTLKRQRMRIYMMVHRGTIPYIRRYGRLYFDKQALDDWMRTGAHHLCHEPSDPPDTTRPSTPHREPPPSALWRRRKPIT